MLCPTPKMQSLQIISCLFVTILPIDYSQESLISKYCILNCEKIRKRVLDWDSQLSFFFAAIHSTEALKNKIYLENRKFCRSVKNERNYIAG